MTAPVPMHEKGEVAILQDDFVGGAEAAATERMPVYIMSSRDHCVEHCGVSLTADSASLILFTAPRIHPQQHEDRSGQPQSHS